MTECIKLLREEILRLRAEAEGYRAAVVIMAIAMIAFLVADAWRGCP